MSWDWVKRLHELQEQATPVVLVSVCQVGGSAPREVGAKMLVFADGTFEGTIGGGNLEHLAIDDAQTSLLNTGSRQVRYPLAAKTGQCCGGYVDLLFEVLNQGPQLHVFGAGHVGQAVAAVVSDTAFRVNLVDARQEWLNKAESLRSVKCHCMSWQHYLESNHVKPGDYALVMTHSHKDDQEIIARLLQKPCRYIGLIGSRGKWQRFQQRLKLDGFSESQLSQVHCPIGIPTGGKAPKEIAVSVAAEILSLHYQTMSPDKAHDLYDETTTTHLT